MSSPSRSPHLVRFIAAAAAALGLACGKTGVSLPAAAISVDALQLTFGPLAATTASTLTL